MKVLQVFTVVCIAFAAANPLLLHSGNFQASGSFQAHPWLAHHRWFQPSSGSAAPLETSSTTTTESAPINTVSYNIDTRKVINDLVGVNVVLLKHFQRGISERFDRHVQRLNQFEKHVNEHFAKRAESTPSTSHSSGDSNSFTIDANLTINKGTKHVAPAETPAPTTTEAASDPVSTNDSFDFDSGDSDFVVADTALPAASNCSHK